MASILANNRPHKDSLRASCDFVHNCLGLAAPTLLDGSRYNPFSFCPHSSPSAFSVSSPLFPPRPTIPNTRLPRSVLQGVFRRYSPLIRPTARGPESPRQRRVLVVLKTMPKLKALAKDYDLLAIRMSPLLVLSFMIIRFRLVPLLRRVAPASGAGRALVTVERGRTLLFGMQKNMMSELVTPGSDVLTPMFMTAFRTGRILTLFRITSLGMSSSLITLFTFWAFAAKKLSCSVDKLFNKR